MAPGGGAMRELAPLQVALVAIAELVARLTNRASNNTK
ncbi:hypothetical protein PC114_g22397 [Phytophthora cactorum]|nr:hypothetical protein PC114_g22397 [Phytophthora cactorum]KAG3141035.1 hypothetical protein PC128_g25062 [Phytophthora cactorum]KAG4039489.1 hypothetical protein PC123_g24963 [Phytophthora cactorum]